MKPGLLFLPFIALIVASLGIAIGSAFVLPIAHYLGLGLGLIILASWVFLDLDNFKRFFNRKGAKYGASSGLVVIMGIAVIVLVAVITNRPRFNKSFDATKSKANTLAEQSFKIIEKTASLNEPIKITGFFKQDDIREEFTSLINLYLAKNAKLSLEYIDTDSNPTKAMAEKIVSENTAIFRYGQQESRITTFTEEKITNAIIKVLKAENKKIYFTSGHGERSITKEEGDGLSFVTEQLKNNKYEVSELSLLEQLKIDQDASLIVIAGPKYDFKKEELRLLEDYLARGGALLVMIDAMVPANELNQFLNAYGININSDLVILRPDDPRARLLGSNNAIISDFDEFNPITRDLAHGAAVDLLLPNTRTLSDIADNKEGFKVSLIAKTSDEMVKIKDVKSEADLAHVDANRVETGSFSVLALAVGKAKISPPIAANEGTDSIKKTDEQTATSDATPAPSDQEKNIESRIAVMGSSELASNAQMIRQEHLDLFLNINNYLLQDEDFISIRPKESAKSELNITSNMGSLSLMFVSLIYPFCFLGFGVWYWLRRRAA